MNGNLSDLLLAAGHQDTNRIYGVVIGRVTNNKDEDGLGRVKVSFPWLPEDNETDWVRIAVLMAGHERGAYFLPEVGDEVLVAFEHGDPAHPYMLGALWNGQAKPPEPYDEGKNNMRTIRSRSGHVIRLNDKHGAEKIEIIDGAGKESIVISTADNTITITADADVTIQAKNGTLKLSGKGVEIRSQAAVTITASQGLDLEAVEALTIKGKTVDIN
jgi:phage baseplate assembly protein V